MGSVALLLAAPISMGQGTPQELPPPGGGTPALTKDSADPASLSLRLEAGKLPAAVDKLQAALEAAHKPGVNVIYGPGTQSLEIPQLTLRKVNGTDAVRLIAVSAGCTVELILGDNGDTIGYKIQAPTSGPEAFMNGGSGMMSAPRPVKADRGSSPQEKLTPGAPQAATPKQVASAVASNAVIGFTAPPQSGPLVRVYSLGEITTRVKFGDVVQTLEELLTASGIALDSAKVAVHEKTNVLVVTGEQRVQEVVRQLVEALQKNSEVAAAQNSHEENARLEKVELQARLNLETEQTKRLQMRLEESEAQITKLQRELDRVSHATAPAAK
jgi:hypothetical protein